ncbi:MAG: GDSL-type esterase/lipase family protein [Anaerolineae bacterium]|nr:GDSL-type esterase/lipase family protein [Anaerolineae bacterium]
MAAGLRWGMALGLAMGQFTTTGLAAQSNPNPPIKIMVLGDSLTAGEGASGFQSYRGHLYQLLTAEGHKVDFVGSQRSPNMVEADEDHEGHSGYTIGPDNARYCSTVNNELACGPERYNLFDNVEQWLKQNPPDVILLHVGINDLLPQTVTVGGAGIDRQVDPDRAPQRLQNLVKRIRAFAPKAKLVTSSLLQVRWRDGSTWEQYRAVNAMAQQLGQNRDDGMYFADLNAVSLSNGDFYDSLHLTNAGANKVAKAWFEVVNPILKRWTFAQPKALSVDASLVENASATSPESNSCANNLLKNATFGDGLANWEDWGGATMTEEAHLGRAMQIGPSVGGAGQMVPAIAASSYTLAVWAKRTGKPVWAGFGIAFWDSGNSKLAMYSIEDIASTYTAYTITAVAPWGSTRAQVWAWTNGEEGNLFIDDICLLPTWMAQRSNTAVASAVTPVPVPAETKPAVTAIPAARPVVAAVAAKPAVAAVVKPAAKPTARPVVQPAVKKQVRPAPTPVRKR